MKVAIVGKGGQGQKHGNVWRKFGVMPQFFSKFGSSNVRAFLDLNISELYSFDCVVIAVSPIAEQEGVIRRILSMQYPGLLIIEKPVCNDLDLLFVLKNRKNTVFFIDEIFLCDKIVNISMVSHFNIYTTHISDASNVLEHAFGCFFSQTDFLKIISVPVYCNIAASTYYKVHSADIDNTSGVLIDSESGDFSWISSKSFRFDIMYKELLLKYKNFQWLDMVRQNYYTFRLSASTGNK